MWFLLRSQKTFEPIEYYDFQILPGLNAREDETCVSFLKPWKNGLWSNRASGISENPGGEGWGGRGQIVI